MKYKLLPLIKNAISQTIDQHSVHTPVTNI